MNKASKETMERALSNFQMFADPEEFGVKKKIPKKPRPKKIKTGKASKKQIEQAFMPCPKCKFGESLDFVGLDKDNHPLHICSQFKRKRYFFKNLEDGCKKYQPAVKKPKAKPKIRILNCRMDKIASKVVGMLEKYNPDAIDDFKARVEPLIEAIFADKDSAKNLSLIYFAISKYFQLVG